MNQINRGRLASLLPCILALLPFSLGIAGPAPSSQLTVDLGYSVYQGISVADPVTNKTNTNFLGIRYAAPPTAALRFAAPHPPASTSGVQIASTQPNRCWAANSGTQPSTPFRNPTAGAGTKAGARRSGGPESGMSNSEARSEDAAVVPSFDEDCLFLNVFVPGALGQNRDLPVVVWIHGGGYVSGSASGFSGTDIQDGNDLIREANNGVIAVVIQYRLGVFGFLPGQKVKDGGALNAGLLDQQFALQWVQKHINKFGGDPAKVTIWGESAGAGSVLQHVIANGGNTHPALFRAAITSSSFLPSQYAFNDRIPEILYTESVSQSNCSTSTDTLACLREVDVNTIQAANVNICNSVFFGTFAFVPVVDGTLITERPTQLLKQGKVNGEILYSVTNTFEGALFVDQSTANTVQIPQYISQLFPAFGSKEIEATQAQYAGLGSNIFQAVAIMGESIFICPTYFLLRAFKGRAFKGEFAIPPGGHGNDLAYYFPTTMNANGIPPYGNPQFDASFAESFLKFALSLNPNAKFDSADITPLWALWQESNEMLFNRTEGGDPDIRLIDTSNALLKRCDFWEGVGELTGQ